VGGLLYRQRSNEAVRVAGMRPNGSGFQVCKSRRSSETESELGDPLSRCSRDDAPDCANGSPISEFFPRRGLPARRRQNRPARQAGPINTNHGTPRQGPYALSCWGRLVLLRPTSLFGFGEVPVHHVFSRDLPSSVGTIRTPVECYEMARSGILFAVSCGSRILTPPTILMGRNTDEHP
jgi:hypothetical protein